ncbi:hypothetical protein Ancab_016996 [Ancistrocladus abbreviatus]
MDHCLSVLGAVVEEARNKLVPVTQEVGIPDTVGLEPSNNINYSRLEGSASGPDFICEGLGMLTTQFRFQTKSCGGNSVE